MQDFLDAWALFHDAWLVALLLATLLPLCGIVLVLRQQLFLSAAVGQASTLGIALGIWFGLAPTAVVGTAHTETFSLLFAIAGGGVTAVAAMRALSTTGSHVEARSAWMFLAGSSLSVLLSTADPHGLEEVRRLTLSSLLGVSALDVWLAAGALAFTLGLCAVRSRRVLLWAMDPVTTRAQGSSLLALDLAVGAWLGVCTGFAIHATGLLFAFGLTVLPVLVVREVATSLRGVLWLAPLVGAADTVVSLWLAHVLDLPPGQVAVGVLVLLLPVAAGARRLWRATAG